MRIEKTDQQVSDDIKAIALAVAAALGTGWEVKRVHEAAESENPPSWYLAGPGGERLNIGYAYHSPPDYLRLQIYGSVPNNAPDNRWWIGCGCSITVAINRPPADVAKEIGRRVMPEYLQKLADAHAKREANRAYAERVQANRAALMAAFEYTPRKNDEGKESFSTTSGPAGYADVQVSSDSARLDLRSVPVKLAVQIAELMTAYDAAN